MRNKSTKSLTTDKQEAIRHIRELPDGVSLAQIAEEIAILQRVREGERDLDEGRFISHEQFQRQLKRWLSR
jgi:predicted transcriptional regulator